MTAAAAPTGKSSSNATRLRRERAADKSPATPVPTGVTASIPIPIDQVAPSAFNPRKHFDEQSLQDLAASIRAVGVLQPIVVREGGVQGAIYGIVAGERRWRAAKLAGLRDIPAVMLVGGGTAAALQAAIVENVQREDLSPMDLADAIADLLATGMTQAEAGKALGMSQSRVAHVLKLRELPGEVQQILASSAHLKTAHAEALTRWNAFPAFAAVVARTAVEESWSAKRIAEPDFDMLDETLESDHPDDDPPELFVSLRYGGVFERANCLECPWAAFVEIPEERVGLPPARYCLRPEHAREISELLNAERVQAFQQQVAQARPAVAGSADDAASHMSGAAASSEIPRIRDLHYSTYARLDRTGVPRACLNRECACIGEALDYNDAVLDICTDPNRLHSLQAQLTRARNAENRRRGVEAASKVEDHVRAHAAVMSTRDLLLMLHSAVNAMGTYGITSRRFEEVWQEAARTWLHDKAPSIERLRGVDKPGLDKLASTLGAPELLKTIVEATCRTDVELRFDPDGGASFGALTDWYVGGGLPARAGNDWQPEAPAAAPKKAKAKS